MLKDDRPYIAGAITAAEAQKQLLLRRRRYRDIAEKDILPIFMKQLNTMLASDGATDSLRFMLPVTISGVPINMNVKDYRRQLKLAFIQILQDLGYVVHQDHEFPNLIIVYFGDYSLKKIK